MVWALASCKLDLNEPLSWQTDVLTPIAFSEVGVTELFADTSLLEKEGDQSMKIVYRDTLTQTLASDLFHIPDTTIIRRFDLSTFTLADQVIVQRITLGQLARNLSAQGNIAGDIILLSHGGVIPSLETFQGLTSGVLDVDASELFEYAALTSGNMEIKIANYLPLDMANISLRLQNSTLGSIIVNDFYTYIPKQDSVSHFHQLDNKEVESKLKAEMLNLDILGSEGQPVPIDTNDYVEVTLLVKNLKASEATAIFPNQTVSEVTEDLVYEFSGDQSDIALKQVQVRSGFIRAEIVSTIEDTIEFEYALPSATSNGQSPLIRRKILPASADQPAHFTEVFDLSGYTIDLTKRGDTVNTMEQTYRIDLVYSGKLVRIDLQDSVYARFQLVDIVPDFVLGYLGQGTVAVTGAERLHIFEEGEVKGVNFEHATAQISFINSIGMNVRATLNSLVGINLGNNRLVELQGIPFSGPIEIPGPGIQEVGSEVTTSISLTPSNSNLREMVNLLPDEVHYDLNVDYNAGTIPFADNFALYNSSLTSFLDLEIPIFGTTQGISLGDTAEVDFSQADISRISGGSLRLVVDSDFPVMATVYATLFDQNGQLVSKLIDGQLVEAALTEPGGGRILQPVTSTLEKSFSREELEQIIQRASKLAISYSVHTSGEAVRLYHDYKIRAKLVGQFQYSVN